MTQQLNFHRDTTPIKIPGSHNLYYDPIQIDRELTRMFQMGDAYFDEDNRNTRATRR
ncbi:hypothetical protein [Bradyrhizobium macuxiense]|uniref:hypothetical protein n=1 Tax=Bradyrhizobium macuxiense TaxID=1755647 RepID=UPI001365ED24|nr:hypothetical protein [Bradyrhizobium macuxiense]